MDNDADMAVKKSGYAPESTRCAHTQGGKSVFSKEIAPEGTRGEGEEEGEDRSSRIRRACPLVQGSLRSPILLYTTDSHLSLL